MWTKKFWKDAAERLVKTFLQSFLALVTADAVLTGLNGGGWEVVVSALIAAGYSGVSSVASTLWASADSASLVE